MYAQFTPSDDRLLITTAQAPPLRACFEARFPMTVITSAAHVLEQISLLHPHLILLDTALPEGNGFDLCRSIRQQFVSASVPIVMLHKPAHVQHWTATLSDGLSAHPATETTSLIQDLTQQAIAAGAADCFVAPLNLELVFARCEAYILCAHEVNRHIRQLRLQALNVVMDLVGLRDQNTGEHIQRTRAYVRLLSQELSRSPSYADALTPASIDWITLAAPLHDIGKLSVPDHLLHKATALTPTERIIMQTHPLSGMLALEIAERQHTGPAEFFRFAKEIALSHHEKWDGTGYPMGLKGDQIPLSAQLVAVADAYDALRSERSYKSAQPHALAVAEITASSGTHFSPAVVQAFLAKAHEFATRAAPPLLRS